MHDRLSRACLSLVLLAEQAENLLAAELVAGLAESLAADFAAFEVAASLAVALQELRRLVQFQAAHHRLVLWLAGSLAREQFLGETSSARMQRAR